MINWSSTSVFSCSTNRLGSGEPYNPTHRFKVVKCERFVFRQLCTAALTWPISTWPKEAPSLSTTWSSTNRRPSTRCGTTWWTLSGQWAQTGSGPVGWSTETLRVLKGFLSLLMFDWFNETLEQKFKRTESSVGELTAAGAAGKCLQN